MTLSALFLSSPALALPKFKDVDPRALALKDCPTEPGCDALVVLDETELSNESARSRVSFHRVIKLFTEKGIMEHADVEISEIIGGDMIKNLAGRTILPDGSEVELSQDNIMVKTAFKRGKTRVRVKTAKFAGVVPGAMVEYSYDYVDPRASNYTRYVWDIQQDLPVLKSKLTLKRGEIDFSWVQTGLQKLDIVHTHPFKNVDYFTVENVPSLPLEPFSPPAEALRSRVRLFIPDLQATWVGEMAGRVAGFTGRFIDQPKGVPEKVRELVAASDPPMERIKKIYRFVQEKIGTEDDRAERSEEEAVKDAESAADVLARGYGNALERTMLFLAMVKEAGLPNGLLFIVDREEGMLTVEAPDSDQFDAFAAAVQIGGGWHFFDPSNRDCPFGMLSAGKEAPGAPNAVHITPDKNAGMTIMKVINQTRVPRSTTAPYAIVSLPMARAAKNVGNRMAGVALLEDGSARVEVQEQGTGHVGLDLRKQYARRDEESRRNALRDHLHEALPEASITTAAFQGLDDPEQELAVKYEFSLPRAASAAGDQVLVTPALFHAGRRNPFTAETRLTDIHFPHTYRWVDRTTFTLPPSHEVTELPAATALREPPFLYISSFAMEDGQLIHHRRVEVDALVVPAASYAAVRSFWQKVQEADRVTITLQRKP